MPRRSITDEEVGLIKAMLARMMRNRDIQFYFNRPDRPVNSGRITQIKQGTYGPQVPVAEDHDVQAFLDAFAENRPRMVIAEPIIATLADRAAGRFERRDDGHWYLADGKTAEQECKERFDLNRMNPIIKAIAALANNRGGFVFLGVENANCRVVGLNSVDFRSVDIVDISNKIRSFLTPTPVFQKGTFTLSQFEVGVIQFEKCKQPPIVVCRDGDGLEDGTILFRYPGQSARIKYGDLFEMLRERDHSAHTALLSAAARLSKIGTNKALIVDTDARTLDAGDLSITIDRNLAQQLEFIREGEFQEIDGAPTLRLIGDVRAVDDAGHVRERIEGRALTPDMVLNAYLHRERVRSPLEYISVSALTQRQWLPLFYFARLNGQGVDAAIEALDRIQAQYQRSKQLALMRLRRHRSAYTRLSGRAIPVGQEIEAGHIAAIANRYPPDLIARAVQGLPEDFDNILPLLELLAVLHEATGNNVIVRGAIYKAASRLDEIEFVRESAQ